MNTQAWCSEPQTTTHQLLMVRNYGLSPSYKDAHVSPLLKEVTKEALRDLSLVFILPAVIMAATQTRSGRVGQFRAFS